MNNITVIGIGKLGLGFALLLESVGYNVVGVDISQEYINKINKKEYTSQEPEYETLLQNSKNFRASTSLIEGINHSDIIFVIVQTPNSGGERFYDHSILSDVLVNINKIKPSKKNIIISCTIMPNYINTIGSYLIRDCNESYLSYIPHFVEQGDIIHGYKNPDIILVGTYNIHLEPKIRDIYSKIISEPVKYCFMKPLEAEIVKISIHGFITTKITYANMISDFCDNINIDKNVVLDTISSDSRIGNKYFRAGYSFGDSCFSRDTKTLGLILEQSNINNDLLVSNTTYNNFHILFEVKQLLNQNKNEYIFENVCYKENSSIPIIEESIKLKIAKELVKNNKKVTIRDNQEIITEVLKEFGNIFNYEVI